MTALAYENVHKHFGDRVALHDVTFAVEPGEVFGLLGPNGAGKTTLIRLALDILRADGGEVRLLGAPVREADHDRVAYLPEERGLYRQARVIDVMTYLAKLKGLRGADARDRSMGWLEKVGLAHVARLKIEQLSKGMSQKVQIAATLVADPELAILDEPFSGLDPLHVESVLELIRERRERGRTTILSTHLMDRVEALCDRMVLMSRGERVLYGTVEAIRREHGRGEVRVEAERLPRAHPMIASVRAGAGGAATVVLADGVEPAALLEALVADGAGVRRFEPTRASIEDIFKTTVRESTMRETTGRAGEGP